MRGSLPHATTCLVVSTLAWGTIGVRGAQISTSAGQQWYGGIVRVGTYVGRIEHEAVVSCTELSWAKPQPASLPLQLALSAPCFIFE